MKYRSLKVMSLAVLLALSYSGCGGSSTSSNDPEVVPLKGVAIDGYLENAKVCLDLNLNRTCDSDEPSAYTDKDGKFIFMVKKSKVGSSPIIVEAIAGKTIDKDTAKTVANSFTLSAPKGQYVVTPITTLIQNELENNATISVKKAAANLSKKLNLTPKSEKLLTDYVANTQLHKLHELAKTVVELMVKIEGQIVTNLDINKTKETKKGLDYLVNNKIIENIPVLVKEIKDNNKTAKELHTEILGVANNVNVSKDELDKAIGKTSTIVKLLQGKTVYEEDGEYKGTIQSLTFSDDMKKIKCHDKDGSYTDTITKVTESVFTVIGDEKVEGSYKLVSYTDDYIELLVNYPGIKVTKRFYYDEAKAKAYYKIGTTTIKTLVGSLYGGDASKKNSIVTMTFF